MTQTVDVITVSSYHMPPGIRGNSEKDGWGRLSLTLWRTVSRLVTDFKIRLGETGAGPTHGQ